MSSCLAQQANKMRRTRTFTFPCRSKLNTAKEHTWPKPSTCIVNSRKKSTISEAQFGRVKRRTKGVKTTESNSCPNVAIRIAKSCPNSACSLRRIALTNIYVEMKVVSHRLGMQFAFPFFWHVMGIHHHLSHEPVRVKHTVLVSFFKQKTAYERKKYG